MFARHFTLANHVEHLKRTKVGVAIGTPGRVSALLNDTGSSHSPFPSLLPVTDPPSRKTDALNLRALSHILLDVSFLDTKNRSLLDTRETKDEIFRSFFTNERILERLRGGKCEVVLF